MKRRMRRRSNPKKIMYFIITILLIIGVSLGINILNEKKKEEKYQNEWSKLLEEDRIIIEEIIALAKEKIGMEYVWGGKGEMMTDERLDELIDYYGEGYYPLDRDEYIEKQAFDCSGLTFYLYNEVMGELIGYSTDDQEEILADYEISEEDILPGDLIYTPGHVVIYIGNGKIIHSYNKLRYPIGGVKEDKLKISEKSVIYRPIDYIKDLD